MIALGKPWRTKSGTDFPTRPRSECILLGQFPPLALFPCLDPRLGGGRTVPETERLVAGLHDMAVMCQPVEQRRGHLGVAEDGGPFPEGQVGGDDHRGALVELADQMEEALAAGLGGLECLSGIPGSAGATPVQNVGAYGVEVSDTLTRVRLLDRRTGGVDWVAADRLGLAYRTSVLKGSAEAVVLDVHAGSEEQAAVRYAELSVAFGAELEVIAVRHVGLVGVRQPLGVIAEGPHLGVVAQRHGGDAARAGRHQQGAHKVRNQY